MKSDDIHLLHEFSSCKLNLIIDLNMMSRFGQRKWKTGPQTEQKC